MDTYPEYNSASPPIISNIKTINRRRPYINRRIISRNSTTVELCEKTSLNILLALVENPQSILYTAILVNNHDYIKYVAEKFPELLSLPDLADCYPIHAFAYTITKDKLNTLRICISAGINIHQQDRNYQRTLLSHILSSLYIDAVDYDENTYAIIKLLLDSGADINLTDLSLETPLFILIGCMADTEKDGLNEYKELFELFIDYGANPYIKNITNNTILDYIDGWLAPTCQNEEDSEPPEELNWKYSLYNNLAKYVYQCINNRTGKKMLATMTSGYFLVIPRDIREYIACFNVDEPQRGQ